MKSEVDQIHMTCTLTGTGLETDLFALETFFEELSALGKKNK